jgi:hypothetical protein
MEVIRLLKNREMEVKEAQTIKGLLDSIIDTAKTQVEFIKAIPNCVKEQLSVNEVKAIAGTLQDRDAELDVSMKEIEERRKKPYQYNG